jgi:hypothetical protein
MSIIVRMMHSVQDRIKKYGAQRVGVCKNKKKNDTRMGKQASHYARRIIGHPGKIAV